VLQLGSSVKAIEEATGLGVHGGPGEWLFSNALLRMGIVAFAEVNNLPAMLDPPRS